jgi:ribonuclease-3
MDEKRRAKIQELLSNPIFNIVNVKEGALNRYDQALTHSSYAKEMKDRGIECDDYERLEFFGNFVLNFVVSEYICKFKKFKDDSEGCMTKRMEIVSNEILAEIIKEKKIGIEKLIKVGKGVSGNKEDLEDSIVADAFEALIGAVYLDKGMQKVKKIIVGTLSDKIEKFDPERNYIGRLQEFVQINNLGLKYKEKKTGPDHSPTFRVVVEISGKPCGEGEGGRKRDARRKAARAALNKIKYKSKKRL